MHDLQAQVIHHLLDLGVGDRADGRYLHGGVADFLHLLERRRQILGGLGEFTDGVELCCENGFGRHDSS